MAQHEELPWTQYVTKAFTWQWNLLAFGAAVVVGVISGMPDIVLPVVLAGELAYLGAMTAHPKFRKSVDVAHHKSLNTESALKTRRTRVADTLHTLSHDRRERFGVLRDRCIHMNRLAAGVRGQAGSSPMHTGSLDKMLWTFLRLLASQQALASFNSSTDATKMERRVRDLKRQVEEAKGRDEEKITRALIDSLATATLRFNNLEKADENARFVTIELDRIEDKIQALVEMAVSHEDPDFISGQVDDVAASMIDTEAAMREMSFVPDEFDEVAPAIMSEAAY